jgi:D-alanyl-lipoteichoic acid acyltransferase DltB (MBOAT superfamily)
LILFGLFKKLVLSSFLVLNLTDDIFAVPENHSALGIALAIVAYTLVIYFDFSGYSDMAIGFAGLLGFKTPPNFNFPYLATNLKEFWKRWHISLSSWIKDYIYIPLGGNRKGAAKKHFNLIFSMVAAGLWHGAAGHFIFWGLWHGGGSSVNHVWLDFKKIRPLKHGAITSILGKIFGWLLTFIFVSVGWVFFRAGSFTLGWKMLRGLFNFERPTEPLPILVFVAVVGGVIFLFLEKPLLDIFNKIQARLPFILWLLLILLAFLVLFKMGPETVPPFIYFSF